MSPEDFFRASRVIIVAGKGGVGKTVTAATLAAAAARIGLTVDLVDVEGKSGLATLFGSEGLNYEPSVLRKDPSGGEVRGRFLTADDALVEWLGDHGMSLVAKRLRRSGVLDVIATGTPGIKDLLVLGKVKQLEREGDADVVIIDAPAAGHAITFLQSPKTLADTARVGPVHTQAKDVLDMLSDPERCRVLLVTLAEETPVNELIETAFRLEDLVGVHLLPVIVNGIYPELELTGEPPRISGDIVDDLAVAAELRHTRSVNQQHQIRRLAAELPLPHIDLPFLFDPSFGPEQIDKLADALLRHIESMAG